MDTNKAYIHPTDKPDLHIKRIRIWRGLVNTLKITRAKGYCEICGKYVGVVNLRGHHKIKPSEYKGNDPNGAENSIITCKNCSPKKE